MNRIIAHVIVALAVLLVSGKAYAQSDKEALIKQGERDYRLYCAQCHGEDGKGEGEMAPMLSKKPSDLTHIYRGAGKFPYKRVAKIIETGGAIIGHGGEMPVWGETFKEEAMPKIQGLIHYLEILQGRSGG